MNETFWTFTRNTDKCITWSEVTRHTCAAIQFDFYYFHYQFIIMDCVLFLEWRSGQTFSHNRTCINKLTVSST